MNSRGYEFTGDLKSLYDGSQLEQYEPRGRNQGKEWRWKRAYCEKMIEMATAFEVAERMTAEPDRDILVGGFIRNNAWHTANAPSKYARARMTWERHLAIAQHKNVPFK